MASSEPPLPPSGGGTIVVADDDRLTRELVAGMLRGRGYDVEAVGDGQAAVERVARGGVHLVLLDVLMPKLGGLEACRLLKGMTSGAFLPVVLVTVKTDTQSRVEGLRIGADDYVCKPFEENELVARVEAMLRIKRLHDHVAVARARLEQLSIHDDLTGLYNYRHLHVRLGEEFKRAERHHESVRANFLMSPPLVVAFALAGRVNIDMENEPLGQGEQGEDVYLRDIWPTLEEVGEVLGAATDPETYRRLYSDFAAANPLWNDIPSVTGEVYQWDPQSTYIQEPPYFEKFSMEPGSFCDILGARPLAVFGDSVTTDHISPAGAIKVKTPGGRYLLLRGVEQQDFNSYGSRRGNHQVMVRGTFANVRIKNLLAPGTEGGVTTLQPTGELMPIYDASMHYQAAGVPLVVFAGEEYGTGSSRDWAAKGTLLLGVKAVIAESFERIHRSNLVGMGVLPLQFKNHTNAETLALDGTETIDITGLQGGEIAPRQDVTLRIRRADGAEREVPVTLRIDTPIEIEYYRHGGILPFVLRQLISQSS